MCSSDLPRLQIRDHHAWVPHHTPRPRQPLRHRCRLAGLQRVPRCHQPPNPVQPHPCQGFLCDMHMARMRRIKRPAQKANNHTLTCNGETLFHLKWLAHLVARLESENETVPKSFLFASALHGLPSGSQPKALKDCQEVSPPIFKFTSRKIYIKIF